MSILLSRPVQEKLEKSGSRLPISKIVARLESINTSDLRRGEYARRVNGTTEEIYVMYVDDLRVFFTKKGTDIVLLGIGNRWQ